MEQLKILFNIHLFVIFANIVIASLLWYGTRSRLARNLTLGWVLYLLAGVGNILVVNQPFWVRYLVAMPPSLGMTIVYAAMTGELFGMQVRWRTVFWISGFAFLTGVLLIFLKVPPVVYGLVLCFGATFAMFLCIFDLMRARKKGSFIRYSAAFFVFLLAAHMMDYPLMMHRPDLVEIGLYGALLIVFGISIFAPAAISDYVSAENARISTELEYSKRMVEVARSAGMAEVAIGVLHNVGNVLNSINVSASVIEQTTRQTKLSDLGRAVEKLVAHRSDLGDFVKNDPSGQSVLPYLSELTRILNGDNEAVRGEIARLTQLIETVKQVISVQQSYAKLGQAVERLDAREVIENAIQINAQGLERHHVRLFRDYQTVTPIEVDKQRLLQILVNLVGNAKYALDEADISQRRLTVHLSGDGTSGVRIAVEDNGAGIAPEHADRIFRFGFTTRKDGHGFGLHNSANAAKELGGALKFESGGRGKGAVFTLTIPVERPKPS